MRCRCRYLILVAHPVHFIRAQVTDAAQAGTAAAAAAVEEQASLVNGLTLEQRFQLCRSIGEECVTGAVCPHLPPTMTVA